MAMFGQSKAAGLPVEERDTEIDLEVLYLLTDRALGYEQFLRGKLEAEVACSGFKSAYCL